MQDSNEAETMRAVSWDTQTAPNLASYVASRVYIQTQSGVARWGPRNYNLNLDYEFVEVALVFVDPKIEGPSPPSLPE